jgi:hypothetical protein
LPGSFCPAASSAPSPCISGYACTVANMAVSSVTQCSAGYYCPSGSSSAMQIQCLGGFFCPVSSAAPFACAAGADCPAAMPSAPVAGSCPAGSYCAGILML